MHSCLCGRKINSNVREAIREHLEYLDSIETADATDVSRSRKVFSGISIELRYHREKGLYYICGDRTREDGKIVSNILQIVSYFLEHGLQI